MRHDLQPLVKQLAPQAQDPRQVLLSLEAEVAALDRLRQALHAGEAKNTEPHDEASLMLLGTKLMLPLWVLPSCLATWAGSTRAMPAHACSSHPTLAQMWWT